jgi:hypothetical protein
MIDRHRASAGTVVVTCLARFSVYGGDDSSFR